MISLVVLAAMALTPVERAVAYLSKEVPRWRGENGCFSCHNNGDGARALFRAGVAPEGPVLAETTEWLANPGRWAANPGNPAVSDKTLARIQFGTALLVFGKQEAVCAAAQLIEKDRGADGAWKVDSGSPATYGTVLATVYAREVLRRCGRETRVTDVWLAGTKPGSVLDAAALLLASPGRKDAREYLQRAQATDGGWGEHPGLPSQVFDTAVAVIALGGDARGRAWLIREQQTEGGWVETTRPPGSQSYAQHVSTTAWALMALLE
ncbi:MAG: hypothetical protein JNM66_11760 [Bryobacterales bacterium]|nr:hypothetical protein [Bryobacterales bacterium]